VYRRFRRSRLEHRGHDRLRVLIECDDRSRLRH
jgi:hypothetical protein